MLAEDWEARALRARDIRLAAKVTIEIELIGQAARGPVFRFAIQIGNNSEDRWVAQRYIDGILPAVEEAWAIHSQPVDYDGIA